MKQSITPSYTFSPGAAGVGTVDLYGISGFNVKKLYAIINIDKNQIIYVVGQSQYGLTNLSGTVLTLAYNTSSMSGSDKLLIIYDVVGQNLMANSAPVVIASDQTAIPVTGTLNANITTAAGTDVLGSTIFASKYNQIEVNFESTLDTNLITNTISGGGSVTQTNGHTLYSTSTATTSSAKGISVQTVEYRPANEIYAYFTAAFTTPTSANSYQRIGIYDTNNGFFIGYNGTTFGLTKRTSGSDTFIPISSFNNDLLDGNSNSNFKRNGTPEAINLTFSNLFRIRFAWLGSGSILFDVFSPDGTWINFHTIKQPNSSLNPSVANPNLPMTVDVSKTSADATLLTIYTACWAAGTTSNLDNINAIITDYTLAALNRSVITGRTTGGGGGYVNVKVTPSGALTTALGDISGVVGQNTMANSLPVTIASNQSAVPVSQSGTWNINNIAGTVSLPTGASTSALQTTGNTSLSAIQTSTASLDTKLPSKGKTVSANSLTVVLATDQANLPVIASPGSIISTPTANNLASLNSTVTYILNSGGSYYLTITNGPAATTAWVGTITFQYSLDNISWFSLATNPIASPASSAQTSTTTANGLYLINPALLNITSATSQQIYVRANMTSYTSGTAYAFVTPANVPNTRVLLPWVYSVTAGNTLSGPIDVSGFSEVDIQISAVTTTVLTAQGTNDPTLTTWVSLPVQDLALNNNAGALTMTAASTYRVMPNGFKWMRIQVTTTGTVLTVQGVVGTLGQPLQLTGYGNSVNVSNISAITGALAAGANTIGAVNENTLYQVAEQASAAITATTTSATKTVTQGVAVSLNVAVTVTSGTGQTYDFSVQSSTDNVNWNTVYQMPRITAVGFYQTPALKLDGSYFRYVETIGGTTPSFTRTISSTRSTANGIYERNIIDRTINPATTNSASAALYCDGYAAYTMIVNQGAGGSAVTFALDGSDDNINWVQGLTQVTGVTGGSTPVSTNYSGSQFRYIRARVVTGVVSATISYVTLVASHQTVANNVTATISGTPNVAVTSLPSLPAGANAIGSVSVSNFPATQTVTGTVNAAQSGTWNVGLNAGSNAIGTVGVTSLPSLPAGANAIGSVSVSNFPSTQNVAITSSVEVEVKNDSGNPLPVSGSVSVSNFPATQPVSGTVTANAGTGNFTVVQATAANLNATVTGTVGASQSGTWNINNISGTVSLPTGAATSANQSTANASLASIDSKLTSPLAIQGGNSTAVKVDGSATTQPVSGTITANAGSGNFTVVQATGTNLHTVVDSGNVTATISGTPNVAVTSLPSIPAGSNLIGSVSVNGTANVLQTNTLVPYNYDNIAATYPTTTQEVYVYKTGLTTVATITVNYTDASKNSISSVVRT